MRIDGSCSCSELRPRDTGRREGFRCPSFFPVFAARFRVGAIFLLLLLLLAMVLLVRVESGGGWIVVAVEWKRAFSTIRSISGIGTTENVLDVVIIISAVVAVAATACTVVVFGGHGGMLQV